MQVDVIMPQMGESIQEGTLVKWLKKPGDAIGRDEPLFEISTDKVDAEIPSPAAGVLSEIKVKEGETVAIKTVVALIETDASMAAGAPSAKPATAAGSQKPAGSAGPVRPTGEAPGAPSGEARPQAGDATALRQAGPDSIPGGRPAERDSARSEGPAQGGARPSGGGGGGGVPYRDGSTAPAPGPGASRGGGTATLLEERLRTKSSPVVRKIAAEHGIEIAALTGSGISGRVTKKDILGYIETQPPAGAAQGTGGGVQPGSAYAPAIPAFSPGERLERVPMTAMRKKIAEHMILSRRTSAHVSTVFEIDMSRIARIRAARKDAFQERHGVSLTYMPFIMKATVDALIAFPSLNASIDGASILYKKDMNLGVAVALDWGLIVPVIKSAQDLSLSGLAKAVNDLATRARAKQLKPEEVQGGTFTITNPGIFGSLFGTPIINQPQVAILGVGTIEKRPVVIDDAIAIRTMGYFAISFDHRLIDGAVADQFMARIKKTLQEFDESMV